jgi:hypothetical protein
MDTDETVMLCMDEVAENTEPIPATRIQAAIWAIHSDRAELRFVTSSPAVAFLLCLIVDLAERE